MFYLGEFFGDVIVFLFEGREVLFILESRVLILDLDFEGSMV